MECSLASVGRGQVTQLYGHEEARRIWQGALSSARMHHAWLLAGQSGLGKGAFAAAAARELVGVSQDTKQHPDIHLLSHPPKDKKEADKQASGKPFEAARNIKIDQIRAMQQRLTTRPTMGERRAIIIDPADDMERGASNALLKSLEEPPVGTFFLLVSNSPARLLPTIRSRCRMLRFAPLEHAQMAEVIDANAPDSDDITRAMAIESSGGSPGKALNFIALGLGDIAVIMRRILDEGDDAFALRGDMIAAAGQRPSREKLRAILDLARVIAAEDMGEVDPAKRSGRINAHGELVKLTSEMPTFNYDPGLLLMEIGTLLAKAARASERANV